MRRRATPGISCVRLRIFLSQAALRPATARRPTARYRGCEKAHPKVLLSTASAVFTVLLPPPLNSSELCATSANRILCLRARLAHLSARRAAKRSAPRMWTRRYSFLAFVAARAALAGADDHTCAAGFVFDVYANGASADAARGPRQKQTVPRRRRGDAATRSRAEAVTAVSRGRPSSKNPIFLRRPNTPVVPKGLIFSGDDTHHRSSSPSRARSAARRRSSRPRSRPRRAAT